MFSMASADFLDGPVELIVPFEALGRRTVRGWSSAHVEAALPGRRQLHSPSVREGAWKTLFALSSYARAGTLPLYPHRRATTDDQIPPSLIWLIYPLYPAPHQRSRGRGLVEKVDGTMIEAVADITDFREIIRRDHAPLPRMGRPLKYPEFFYAALAYWLANPQRVKTGSVLDHIEAHEKAIFDLVPKASRYRLAERARAEAHRVAADF
jgi:hypothetical protein